MSGGGGVLAWNILWETELSIAGYLAGVTQGYSTIHALTVIGELGGWRKLYCISPAVKVSDNWLNGGSL